MGMSGGGDNNGMMAEINVTPFVDVMLVLLIIFMVTAPMMNQGVQVELPEATAGNLDATEDGISLSVTKEGQYYMNEDAITLTDLQSKLKSIIQQNPKQQVYIYGDAQVPYEKVAQLMASCTKAGVTNLSIVTETSSQ